MTTRLLGRFSMSSHFHLKFETFKYAFNVSSCVQPTVRQLSYSSPCQNLKYRRRGLFSSLHYRGVLLEHRHRYSAVPASCQGISLDHTRRVVSIVNPLRGKHDWELPYSWLRDACQCPKCYNSITFSRQSLLRNFDPKCLPQIVQLNRDTQQLTIEWNDGHQSVYGFGFLERRNFAQAAQVHRMQEDTFPERIPWGPELQGKIPTFDYKEIIESDKTTYKFLLGVHQLGLTLIQNAPTDKDGIAPLIKKISYPERTNYGEDFEVISKPNPSNLAYTSVALGLHSDLPFYKTAPGVQVLHCIAQANVDGGENQFADALFCSNLLKETDLETYNLLTQYEVEYFDFGTDYLPDFYMHCRHPIIKLDENGQFERTFYNNQVRDTYQNIPLEVVDKFFEAMKKLEVLLRSNSVEHKLKEGEMVVFNNQRSLHARNGFESSENTHRHLHGWYWRWDELYSRMRRLRMNLKGQIEP